MQNFLSRRLTQPDYLAAIFFWGIRRAFRVQIHRILRLDLARVSISDIPNVPSGFALQVVSNQDDLRELPPNLEAQLNEQCGSSCRTLIEEGSEIYFLVEQDRVASQLNIRRGRVRVDSPTDLLFGFGESDAFLNYLHTREEYRGRNFAKILIDFACQKLACRGIDRCFSHVRGSNFASMTAFRRSGWAPCGYLLTSSSGRLLATPGCGRTGISVEVIKSALSTPSGGLSGPSARAPSRQTPKAR